MRDPVPPCADLTPPLYLPSCLLHPPPPSALLIVIAWATAVV